MKYIVYNRATENDLQVLVDYRIEFLIEFLGEQSIEAIEELKNNLNNYFKRFLIDSSYICYLAKQDNNVVGIGGMIIREQPGNFKNSIGKVGYIMNMYTIPSFRRNGICSNILKHLVEEGKERGVYAFELHATKEGEHVYPKFGFQIHEEPTYRKYLIN